MDKLGLAASSLGITLVLAGCSAGRPDAASLDQEERAIVAAALLTDKDLGEGARQVGDPTEAPMPGAQGLLDAMESMTDIQPSNCQDGFFATSFDNHPASVSVQLFGGDFPEGFEETIYVGATEADLKAVLDFAEACPTFTEKVMDTRTTEHTVSTFDASSVTAGAVGVTDLAKNTVTLTEGDPSTSEVTSATVFALHGKYLLIVRDERASESSGEPTTPAELNDASIDAAQQAFEKIASTLD